MISKEALRMLALGLRSTYDSARHAGCEGVDVWLAVAEIAEKFAEKTAEFALEEQKKADAAAGTLPPAPLKDMTLRDCFAASVIQATYEGWLKTCITAQARGDAAYSTLHNVVHWAAGWAYEVADAMLEAREVRK